MQHTHTHTHTETDIFKLRLVTTK